MKDLLTKLNWKTCHIITVKHKFENVKILDFSDNFLLIETEDKTKVLLNSQFIKNIIEAKEGAILPVFVPHDL